MTTIEEIAPIVDTHARRATIVAIKIAQYIVDANNAMIQVSKVLELSGQHEQAKIYAKIVQQGLEAAEDIDEVFRNHTSDIALLVEYAQEAGENIMKEVDAMVDHYEETIATYKELIATKDDIIKKLGGK